MITDVPRVRIGSYSCMEVTDISYKQFAHCDKEADTLGITDMTIQYIMRLSISDVSLPIYEVLFCASRDF